MEYQVRLRNPREAMILFGENDANLKEIKRVFDVRIVARDTLLKVTGEEAEIERIRALIQDVVTQIRAGIVTTPAEAHAIMRRHIHERTEKKAEELTLEDFLIVDLKSEGQRRYVEAIMRNPIVFCIGPSGTGKTYLAVMMAVSFLRFGLVQKIVLVRPAVEAGEKLGFLPGDFEQKVMPYLRPLYDALYDFMGVEQLRRYRERDIVEIIPLAYMRGRTLNRSFIILDEAQNTTPTQMKMFLTRLGLASKMVVTGDITQIDLEGRQMSGLVHVRRILNGISGVEFVYMSRNDIVRNPIIQEIVEAYERAEGNQQEEGE